MFGRIFPAVNSEEGAEPSRSLAASVCLNSRSLYRYSTRIPVYLYLRVHGALLFGTALQAVSGSLSKRPRRSQSTAVFIEIIIKLQSVLLLPLPLLVVNHLAQPHPRIRNLNRAISNILVLRAGSGANQGSDSGTNSGPGCRRTRIIREHSARGIPASLHLGAHLGSSRVSRGWLSENSRYRVTTVR